MLSFDLYDYYLANKKNNILLSFKGSLSQEILVEMGSLIKNKLKVDKKLKKIFAVFVEMAQNIMHYSFEKEYIEQEDKMVGSGIIVFTESPGYYLITSGNFVNPGNAEALINKIAKINSMNSETLSSEYRRQMRRPQEDNHGAGLGLMEIRRKSSELNCKMTPVDSEKAFIEISAKINKEG
ncbi:MAG: SiaB family protein kinase [Candidatus Kapaibacterium sp.]